MEEVVFNGIDGETGEYLFPPISAEQVAKMALGKAEVQVEDLKEKARQRSDVDLAPRGNPNDLAKQGWGLIIAEQDDQRRAELREALEPLLELRRGQAGDLYREFEKNEFPPGCSKDSFLDVQGLGPGPPVPKKVPYYLLVVGNPEVAPFEFQYEMGVQYAVGRLDLETPESYANYALSVIQSEKQQVKREKAIVLFGVQNRGDRATRLSRSELVRPLYDHLESEQPEWQVQLPSGAATRKEDLSVILESKNGPAVLFTASHGMGFPKGHKLQISHQGALLCRDWPGPGAPVSADQHYYSGDDLSSDAHVGGLVAFHFACYGAGTPRSDYFAEEGQSKSQIAVQPFTAKLPNKLLSHPRGAALAVIGHVERAWGYSFTWPGVGGQIAVFSNTFEDLMDGHRVGSALEYFDYRWAELSTSLIKELDNRRFRRNPDPTALAGLWTANNDARSYVILGDPAVRITV